MNSPFFFPVLSRRGPAVAAACTLLLATGAAAAQSAPGAATASPDVTATVLDPSGAKIAHASVTFYQAQSTDGVALQHAETDSTGRVHVPLAAGDYRVQVQAPGFATQEQAVTLRADSHLQLTVRMPIATKDEAVNVTGDDDGGEGSVSNGESLILKGDRLSTLSDNPTTLQQQLTALVDTGDGTPPQFRIDGFSGGRFPPKSSIREVRINQNAFSAQFDQRGNSVIDIFTKPGTDKLHGFLFLSGNTEALNARNPFITAQPGYYTLFAEGNVNGPLSKNTSFFLGINRYELQNNAAVNAVILNPAFAPVPFAQAIPNPQITNSYYLRIDHQFGQKNTLTGRIDYNDTRQNNNGVGQLVLSSQGYNSDTKMTTLRLGDTTIFSPKLVAESRFQYLRTRTSQTPVSNAPSLVVQGSFNGGGSTGQTYRDAQDNYELQEYLSLDHGKHFFRAGARYRLTRDSNFSTANYNGQYIFPTLTAYQITLQGIAAGQTPAQIRAAGGGASQFSITAGTPAAAILTGDLGAYFEDEWKVGKRFSLISGLRYETQNAIPDHNDPAPRVGFSWQVFRKGGKAPLVTLRGGTGIFYDRFAAGNILTATRQNGIAQQAYYLQNPDFYPNIPSPASLNTTAPTVYRIAPNLHTAYVVASGISASRALGKLGNVTVNYGIERGIHQYLSRNVNAPLNGVRPLGGTQNIYQYSSDGISNTQNISTNFNLRVGARGGMWGSYSARWRQSDVGGAGSFPSNSYNIGVDYGRTAFLARHRLFTGAWYELPYGLSTSFFLAAHSSTRFNVTTGTDLNGDTIYNDRPAFATDLTRASVVRTAIGNFDTAPIAGQTIIPINYGHAPGFFNLQVELGREFSFGRALPEPEGAPKPPPGGKPVKPERQFHLRFSIEAENVFNNVNPATPIGQLSSPYFGRSLTLNSEQTGSTAANRLINLFTQFRF